MPASNPAKNEVVPEDTSDREIVAVRVFDAPRELVWKLWTDPHHVAQWWGPKGFTNTIYEMDVRPGGTWRFVMHGPDGTDYQNKIVYVDVARPERLTYDHVSGPLFHSVVHFNDLGDKTEVHVRMIFESAQLRNKVADEFGAVEGLNQTLGRLGEQLAKRSFVITRTFDAPRELVWRVWTDEKHLQQWFGPKGATIFASKNDLRDGGTYHYGMEHPNGGVMWGRWSYREVDPPNRLVFLQSFSDPEGGVRRAPFSNDFPMEMLATITFREYEGRTTVSIEWSPYNASETEQQFFASMHASMNGGWTGTLDQLGEYLKNVE
jgi:uncharacterized protein YndB with AHSA1/START domain